MALEGVTNYAPGVAGHGGTVRSKSCHAGTHGPCQSPAALGFDHIARAAASSATGHVCRGSLTQRGPRDITRQQDHKPMRMNEQPGRFNQGNWFGKATAKMLCGCAGCVLMLGDRKSTRLNSSN